MRLTKENVYAFDDCAILHQCKITIPKGFQPFFNKAILCYKNFKKLFLLKNTLNDKNISKYRFVPSDIESNIITVANELLDKEGNVRMLPRVFIAKVQEQLKSFFDEICNEYAEIDKVEEISEVKFFFENNEKELTKPRNIPEDDDCKILKALTLFPCNDKKYIISEDEHFWRYKDLILSEFRVYVIEEWSCGSLA